MQLVLQRCSRTLGVLPPSFKPVLQQIKVAAGLMNTADFCLDKITRESRQTRELCHLLRKKSLPSCSYQSGMVMKPVRLLCYMSSLASWTWPCTTFNSIPIILNLLSNRSIALIYSDTICEQKRIVHCQVNFDVHRLTLNQSPLLTMPLAANTRNMYKFCCKK